MYILCVTSHVSVYCLLFLVVYILLEARNNPYNLVFPRISKKFASKHVSACRIVVERVPSPYCYSMREIEAQSDIIR